MFPYRVFSYIHLSQDHPEMYVTFLLFLKRKEKNREMNIGGCLEDDWRMIGGFRCTRFKYCSYETFLLLN